MKCIIVAFLAAIGANAAALERRVDPGCPASMPFQVSPPNIHLCTAYDLSYVRPNWSTLDWKLWVVHCKKCEYSFCSRKTLVTAMGEPTVDTELASPLAHWLNKQINFRVVGIWLGQMHLWATFVQVWFLELCYHNKTVSLRRDYVVLRKKRRTLAAGIGLGFETNRSAFDSQQCRNLQWKYYHLLNQSQTWCHIHGLGPIHTFRAVIVRLLFEVPNTMDNRQTTLGEIVTSKNNSYHGTPFSPTAFCSPFRTKRPSQTSRWQAHKQFIVI